MIRGHIVANLRLRFETQTGLSLLARRRTVIGNVPALTAHDHSRPSRCLGCRLPAIVQLYAVVATETKVLRRWRERDDQSLVKRVALLPDIDPIEELRCIMGEPCEGSSGVRDLPYIGELRDEGRGLRVQQSTLRQLFRPHRSLPFLRA